MSDIEQRSDRYSEILAPLKDTGRILAEALKNYRIGAALCLVLLIAMPVAVLVRQPIPTVCFFLLALVVIICLFFLERRSQRKQIKAMGGIIYDMNGNTVQLADNLNTNQKKEIKEALQHAVRDVAETLDVDPNLLRSNLFGKDDQNNMRMILDLTYNMKWRDEYTVSIPVGYGSTGRCFSAGKPNIAILREDWGKDMLKDEELKKVHPDLKWIISVPVRIGEGKTPPIWVMNVDGLKASANEEKLQKALGKLFIWSKFISLIISKR